MSLHRCKIAKLKPCDSFYADGLRLRCECRYRARRFDIDGWLGSQTHTNMKYSTLERVDGSTTLYASESSIHSIVDARCVRTAGILFVL